MDRLLRIFSRLIQTSAKDDVQLWIIGDGPEKENLIQLTQTLQINNHVYFGGQRKNIMQLLGKAHAFILISENEGFPNSVLEAMAMGVPIIMSNIAGAGEVFTNGENGLLVNPNNDNEIFNAMKKFELLLICVISYVKIHSGKSEKLIL